MAGKIGVYYVKLPNMGDRLNELLCQQYFGLQIKRRSPLTCKISGIGSGLAHFTKADYWLLRSVERLSGICFPEVYIWGTGFIEEKERDTGFYRERMHFCAVRGEWSRKRIEKIVGKPMQIPTGDGGILASELLKEKVEKKYQVGIIPHFKEQKHPAFLLLKERYSNAAVIDLRMDAMEVIRQIAACDYVVSSSLHGLIVADSLGIPNVHIQVSDALLGDGFKFHDYYSGYGLLHEPIVMNPSRKITLNEIVDRYRITPEMVAAKKQIMAETFPFGRKEEA